MIEFLILSANLVVIMALVARRGADRLTKPWFFGSLMGVGAQIGVFVEMMPFSAVHGRFSLRTVLAGMVGVFTMRMVARGVRAWAAGYRDEDRGAARARARLMHPLIALGMAVAGVLMLHEACASRLLSLEIATTPRDRETGIMKGAEPLALDGPAGGGAVLLLHGYLGSPADLGDLPATLHTAGLTVRAPLLPGAGTIPSDLAATHPGQWREAALAAFDELAATHETVHVFGFSAGGWLALEVAAARDAGRVVVANPYLGETWTPTWLPVSTDALAEFVEPLVAYVMRADFLVRLNDRSTLSRLRGYRSVPVGTTVELRQEAAYAVADGLLEDVDEPLLVLLSDDDHTVPPEVTVAALVPLRKERGDDTVAIRTFARSNHILFLDFDREEAVRAVMDWLR